MDYSTVMPYFVTVVVYAVAPGPLMAVLVVRSLGSDFRGAGGFAAGLCAGMMMAAGAVAFGVGVWAEAKPELFSSIKYFGVAYLIWLAVGTWNSRCRQQGFADADRRPVRFGCRRDDAVSGQPGDAVDVLAHGADHGSRRRHRF